MQGDNMKISSTVFENNGRIPDKYTCSGDDISPPLNIEEFPAGTKSLALIVDDPDAPMGTWVHWVVWNIQPGKNISEDNVPGLEGSNDFGKLSYGGPCPPSGTHRYFFKAYALDTELELNKGATKKELLEAIESHVLENVELIGLFSRN